MPLTQEQIAAVCDRIDIGKGLWLPGPRWSIYYRNQLIVVKGRTDFLSKSGAIRSLKSAWSLTQGVRQALADVGVDYYDTKLFSRRVDQSKIVDCLIATGKLTITEHV